MFLMTFLFFSLEKNVFFIEKNERKKCQEEKKVNFV